MKHTYLILLFILTPVFATVGTQNTSVSDVTFLVSSGLTQELNNDLFSATTEQLGVGNYTFVSKDLEAGILYLLLIFPAEPPMGAATRLEKPTYYDVIPEVEHNIYYNNDIIKANITIVNRGHNPDRDGRLLSYIQDKNGNNYSRQQWHFELVPPTCPIGDFRLLEKVCQTAHGNYTPDLFVLEREINLPRNPKSGEWLFIVEYETGIQPLLVDYDSYELRSRFPFILWVIIGIILIAFLRQYFKFKKKAKEKKKSEKQSSQSESYSLQFP